MLVVILSWVYIFIIAFAIGMAVDKWLFGTDNTSIARNCVTGLVTLTVYAETFSIFYKVGLICHLIMLIGAGLCIFLLRGQLFSKLRDFFSQKRLICLAVIVLIGAFCTSRGTFHTDTGIYHAQAIRLLEEYGVLKGLGNLQLHFAYNSSYLPLCALFTFGFMLSSPLHTMTGFFMVLFCAHAVYGLYEFKKRERHGGDFSRIAILIYAMTNLSGLQSPATDYGTMFMVLFILSEWICYAEEKSGDENRDIRTYGYLSVLSIFTVSMKLSAAFLVVLAILPFIMLVKKKMWKELISYLLIGFLSFLPFLVRNVILSGWLFYPVASIDLFNVIWKIPAEYMKIDSDQIKVWGRCLFDVTRVDEPVSSWLPLWWEAKQHYEEMLIYSQAVGLMLVGAVAFFRIREKSFRMSGLVFYLTILVNIAVWFMTAPFIRYALAFLLLLPLCALGDALDLIFRKKDLILIALSGLILINFCSWVDRYFTDDMVFVKQNLTAGYYITQVPFDKGNMTAMDMNGVTVYHADIDEINSYYVYPSTCYDGMAERTELIGSTIEEGFKAK